MGEGLQRLRGGYCGSGRFQSFRAPRSGAHGHCGRVPFRESLFRSAGSRSISCARRHRAQIRRIVLVSRRCGTGAEDTGGECLGTAIVPVGTAWLSENRLHHVHDGLYVSPPRGFRQTSNAICVALVRAQADIDVEPERYKHYFINEIPERFRDKVDVRRFGVGERVVPQPYTRAMFERTQAWMHARNLFDAAPDTGVSYEQAVDS